MTVYDFNKKFDAEGGTQFVVHPEGDYSWMCQKVEKKVEKGGEVVAIKLLLDCEGAKVHDYISFVTTEKYDEEMIRRKISAPLISAGLKKIGDPICPADLMKLGGRGGYCHLVVEPFTSNKTGKELESNKVKYYKDPDSTTSGKSEKGGGYAF